MVGDGEILDQPGNELFVEWNRNFRTGRADIGGAVSLFSAGEQGELTDKKNFAAGFQDGTVQDWEGGTVLNVADSGPLGLGDHSLQLANGGPGDNFAMHNEEINGAIARSVIQINSNILRPAGIGAAEIRLGSSR